jgi:FkbM family methyltransferase
MHVVDVPVYIWRHPANEGKRLRHLARGVRFQLRGRVLHERTIVPIGTSSKMWAELHRTASSRAAYANPPDIEMRVWQRILEPGDLFLDIGANVGIYSLVAAERGAQVIAAEPDPGTCERLLENAALNGYPIEVHCTAVAGAPGRARLTVGLDCVNRLVADDLAESQDVAVVTLDELIGDRRAAGVKVDVEGAEQLVLDGGARALAERRIDLLQLEWTSAPQGPHHPRAPIVDLLDRHGYAMWRDDGHGGLVPLTSWEWRRDVFAKPGTIEQGRRGA